MNTLLKSSLLLFMSCCLYQTVMSKEKISGPNAGKFNSDHPQNLNVVYFIPDDAVVFDDYEKRISELMLWSQDWVKKQMKAQGYENKTFGLLTDKSQGRVKIITVYGKKKIESYPYLDGGPAVYAEVEDYFNAHKQDRGSLYTLIIIPRYRFKPDGVPDGGPFYGGAKSCFALDYEGLDLKHLNKPDAAGHLFGIWFGGLIHELGHGLGLPHNCQKVSENNHPNMGMALMSAGNMTFGKSPTFLTAADAAILNVNPIFNQKINPNPKKSGELLIPNADIKQLNTVYDTQKRSIIVSGRFKSDIGTTGVLYYNDPNVNGEGTGVNRDYNAVTWASKPIGLDSFYVEMPIDELFYKDGSPYELKVNLVHVNGAVTEHTYTYHFENGLPVFDPREYRDELNKSGWKVISYNSEELDGEGTLNGRAIRLIDGNRHTFWHSSWTRRVATFPHELVIGTGKAVLARGFSLTQRAGLSRAVKDIEVMTSNDGVSFVSAGRFTVGNVNGTQYFEFKERMGLKFFKVIVNAAHDGESFAAIAELGLF